MSFFRIRSLFLSGGFLLIGGLALSAQEAPPGSAPAAVIVPSGKNLIENPSFENPSDSYGWSQNNWPKNDVEFALDPDNPHSGAKSQRISLRHVTGVSADLQLSTKVAVTPGMSVQLRFWTRGLPNTRPIEVSLRKRQGPYTTYFQADVALSSTWTESVFNITLPANTDPQDTDLFFDLKEENTYWLDDVSLTELPAQEGGEPLVGNQVKNGSFEVGRDHWYATFRESGASNQADENNAAANTVVRPEKDALNGRNVLAFEVFPACRINLTSAYFHLRYGYPVSIGFWLKTAAVGKPFTVNLGQGAFPNIINETEKFTPANAGWNFYHMSVTPKVSSAGTYYLEFAMVQPGQYELDGVSAVEGGSDQPGFPADRVETGWGLPDGTPPGNLFYPNDQIRFPLLIAAPPGQKAVSAHLRVIDYRGNELKSWDTPVPLDEDGDGQIDVDLPSDRLGGFKVEVYTTKDAAGHVPDTELLYSVVPRLKPVAQAGDSFFGAHVSFTPYNLAIAERLGFRWLRMNGPLSTRWSVVEHEKGKFDLYTKDVSLAHDMGFHILGIFGAVPWFYADGDPVAVRSSTWYSSYPPGDWDAWATYVQKTATAFGPYVEAWEIWNEPDGAFLKVTPPEQKEQIYVKIVQQTRKALDDAGIHTFLIGNVAASIDRPFTVNELELGGGKEVDALSFHLYNEDRGPEEKVPLLADQLAKLRTFPNRSGGVPEIWNTENGIWLSSGRSWLESAEIPTSVNTTIADAANTISRTLAGLKAMGVRRFFYYDAFASPAGSIDYRNECSGIIDVNGIPHAGGAAYAASVYFLEDAAPVGLEVKPVGKGNVSIARFKGAQGAITVIWSRDAVLLKGLPDLDWEQASAFDLMGNPLSLTPDTPITLDPIYLLGKAGAVSP